MLHSQKLLHQDRYSVWLLGNDLAPSMTDFVYDVYHHRFGRTHYWTGNERIEIEKDDRATRDRSLVVCAYGNDGQPLATMKAIRKARRVPLPVERDFDLDFLQLSLDFGFPPNHIFEIGRLAKSGLAMKQAGIDKMQSNFVVEAVIMQLVKLTSYDPRNLWVASIDQIVLNMLRFKGFEFEAVGETVDYLGSPTTPVMLPVEKWQNTNSHHVGSTKLPVELPVAA